VILVPLIPDMTGHTSRWLRWRDRETDGRIPDRYITLFDRRGQLMIKVKSQEN